MQADTAPTPTGAVVATRSQGADDLPGMMGQQLGRQEFPAAAAVETLHADLVAACRHLVDGEIAEFALAPHRAVRARGYRLLGIFDMTALLSCGLRRPSPTRFLTPIDFDDESIHFPEQRPEVCFILFPHARPQI
jgi:hypothetical protein